jgi:addiction module HigA family antidote
MTEKRIPPIHPGETLLKEFLEPMGISQYRLAKDIGVPAMELTINNLDKFTKSISEFCSSIHHEICLFSG